MAVWNSTISQILRNLSEHKLLSNLTSKSLLNSSKHHTYEHHKYLYTRHSIGKKQKMVKFMPFCASSYYISVPLKIMYAIPVVLSWAELWQTKSTTILTTRQFMLILLPLPTRLCNTRHRSTCLFVCLFVSNFTWKLLIGSSCKFYQRHNLWTTKTPPNFGSCPLLDHEVPNTEKLKHGKTAFVYNHKQPELLVWSYMYIANDVHRSVLLPRYRTTYSSAIFIMSPPLTYLQKWRQVL